MIIPILSVIGSIIALIGGRYIVKLKVEEQIEDTKNVALNSPKKVKVNLDAIIMSYNEIGLIRKADQRQNHRPTQKKETSIRVIQESGIFEGSLDPCF